MSSLFGHCHGEKTHFSRNEKRTFSLSQMNNAELARTLSWRENALFEERKEPFFCNRKAEWCKKRAEPQQKKRPGTTYHDARAKRRKTVWSPFAGQIPATWRSLGFVLAWDCRKYSSVEWADTCCRCGKYAPPPHWFRLQWRAWLGQPQ